MLTCTPSCSLALLHAQSSSLAALTLNHAHSCSLALIHAHSHSSMLIRAPSLIHHAYSHSFLLTHAHLHLLILTFTHQYSYASSIFVCTHPFLLALIHAHFHSFSRLHAHLFNCSQSLKSLTCATVYFLTRVVLASVTRGSSVYRESAWSVSFQRRWMTSKWSRSRRKRRRKNRWFETGNQSSDIRFASQFSRWFYHTLVLNKLSDFITLQLRLCLLLCQSVFICLCLSVCLSVYSCLFICLSYTAY